jgi:hypothetical protein
MSRIGKGNTSVRVNGADISVVLHGTEVVKRVNGVITLATGGWFTATTKNRQNQASNQFDLGYYVQQKAGNWLVHYKGATMAFDGNEITLPA